MASFYHEKKKIKIKQNSKFNEYAKLKYAFLNNFYLNIVIKKQQRLIMVYIATNVFTTFIEKCNLSREMRQ